MLRKQKTTMKKRQCSEDGIQQRRPAAARRRNGMAGGDLSSPSGQPGERGFKIAGHDRQRWFTYRRASLNAASTTAGAVAVDVPMTQQHNGPDQIFIDLPDRFARSVFLVS